jgi:hypothetical protein
VVSNLQALTEWAERTEPTDALYRSVAEWVVALDADRFQYPSGSWSLNEGESYEVRMAELVDLEVVTFYTVVHDGLSVDLVGIIRDAPPPWYS